jgi:phytoene dehydrogenase-like protein
LPGFTHDICSAVHATAAASPFMRTLPLQQYGVEWIDPPASIAHPFDDGTAAVVERSIDRTAAALGRDRSAYARLFGGLVRRWPDLEASVMAPLRWPSHPLAFAAFGMRALRSAEGLARHAFAEERTRVLFGGIAAHGLMPLDRLLTGGFGLVLGLMAHVVGWVLPRGGAQKLTDALVAYLCSLGGEVIAGHRVCPRHAP